MAAEDLIAAYGTSYDELRLGTGAFVEQLWLDLGGPDDRRLDEFADAAEAVVNDANRQTAALVEEYVDAYVGTISRTPPASADPLALAEYTVDQLRNSIENVYRRPGITARKALADGKPFEEAMQLAAKRAGGMAEADIALAHRAAGREAMARNGVDGYRRVLTGDSCDLCRVASTQLYRTGDLMPIHTRCDCRIAPVVDGYDGGRIVNRELYRELKADGTLDRLNRRNAGTTGRSRAARAQANRARQARIDGIEQGTLELPTPSRALELVKPAPSPTVRLHGELGPVLVDERHAFTAARAKVDEVLDAGDLRRLGPEVVDDAAGELADLDVPTAPAAEVVRVPRSGQFDPTSASIQRAAIRRNVSPEDIIDELELKRLDRLEVQRAERAALKALDDPNSAEVLEAAAGWGVSPDEFVAARAQVKQARRVVTDAATEAQLRAFERLDRLEGVALRTPPPVGAVDDAGNVLRGGEWDFLETLDPDEQKRLRRTWFRDDVVTDIDQFAENLRFADGGAPSVDDAARYWLRENRIYEATGALRRGKLPSSRAYSGAVDVDAIVEGYMPAGTRLRPSEVIGVSDVDVAGRLAQLAREDDLDDALRFLDRSVDAVHGPPPWRMSFQSFEAELRDLEYGLRNYPSELDDNALARLNELVPEMLDDPGTSYEELYGRIVGTARRGGLDVADYARVPWEDVDVDDYIDDIVRQAELDEAAAAARRLAAAEATAAVDELEDLARRYDDAADVDEVVRRFTERSGVDLVPGKMATEQAATMARTIDDLSARYPLPYRLDAVGDVDGVFKSREVPDGGFNVAGLAKSPDIRAVDGRQVPAGGARLGVRPSFVEDATRAAEKHAAGHYSTPAPTRVITHEYGHHVGYAAEVELYDRYLAGDLRLLGPKPGMTTTGDALRERLWNQEVQAIMRDVIPDAPARGRGGRDVTVAALSDRAGFGSYVPAIRAELSNYGATNSRELIAEAFAEYAEEGANARPLARALAERALELGADLDRRINP